MMSRLGHGAVVLSAATILLLILACAGNAGPLDIAGYAGGGVQTGWVKSEHSSIDGAAGGGFQVVMGTRSRSVPGFGFELRMGGIFVDVGPTPEIAYPADRADYASLIMGFLYRFGVREARNPAPWVSLAASYHNFNWQETYYFIDGLGVTPGAGLDFRLHHRGLLRVGLRVNGFTADSMYDEPADGWSALLTLDYLIEFGPLDHGGAGRVPAPGPAR